MISVNSNCSRIDAVKAAANQLQRQIALAPQKSPESESYRKAQGQLQSLQAQIKTGQAQSAETALSTATSAVKSLQTTGTSSSADQHVLDAYA
jgi:hypothetical protein